MEDLLDIDPDTPAIVDEIAAAKVEELKPYNPASDDAKDDYDMIRSNLKDIIKSGSESIEELMSIAKTSESPRAYEVLSTMIKTVVDSNKELLGLQQTMKKIKEEEGQTPGGAPVTNNAVFVGTPADLQKLLKGVEL